MTTEQLSLLLRYIDLKAAQKARDAVHQTMGPDVDIELEDLIEQLEETCDD
jgi:hypothetical protein